MCLANKGYASAKNASITVSFAAIERTVRQNLRIFLDLHKQGIVSEASISLDKQPLALKHTLLAWSFENPEWRNQRQLEAGIPENLNTNHSPHQPVQC